MRGTQSSGVGGDWGSGSGGPAGPQGPSWPPTCLPQPGCWVRPQGRTGGGPGQEDHSWDSPSPGEPDPLCITPAALAEVTSHILCTEPAQAWTSATRHQTAVISLASPSLAVTPPTVLAVQEEPAHYESRRPHLPRPLAGSSTPLFPRRSRTSQWGLEASWGGHAPAHDRRSKGLPQAGVELAPGQEQQGWGARNSG